VRSDEPDKVTGRRRRELVGLKRYKNTPDI
jgi:hypothetical protein